MTCRDFLNYLLYVEHGAENLQFYLWYRDYAKRFGKLPQRERELSAEYTHTPVTAGAPLSPLPDTWKPGTSKIPGAVQQFISDAFAQESAKSDPRATVPQLAVPAPAWAPGSEYREESPLFTPLRTPPPPPKSGGSGASGQSSGSNPPFSENNQPLAKVNYKQAASEAFEAVEHKWQPCQFAVPTLLPELTRTGRGVVSIQPFRDEISRIIALYLAEGSPRELNLSDRDRKVVLKALAQTTHPSAMEHVKARVEALLRFQSHPNFIRWSICNVNRPRRVCAICMGTVCILLGLAASIAITMGRYARGWRALGAFGWLIGGATLFAGTKGMCVVLNGRHRRQVRPWELWVDTRWESEMRDPKASIETAKSNSYEDEVCMPVSCVGRMLTLQIK